MDVFRVECVAVDAVLSALELLLTRSTQKTMLGDNHAPLPDNKILSCTIDSPGTPDRRSRDLEHRCYSAAGLDQRQFDAGGREPFLGRRPTHEGDDNAVKRTFLRGGGGKRTR